MKISLIYCCVLMAGLLALSVFRRSWLLAVWMTSYLVFPTTFAKVGEAPIYLYDLITLTLIGSFLLSGELRYWPKGVPRWHRWFIGLAFVLSVLFGVVRYGWLPELFWIWGHTSLAWMPFAFGVIALTSVWGEQYRTSARWTLLGCLGALTGMAVIQYADWPGGEAITNLFYSGLGNAQTVEVLRVGVETNRAIGPHYAPTGFAGMALLSLIIFWLVTDEHHRWQRWTVAGLAATIILCTVSRHIMVAAMAGFGVIIAFSEASRKAKLILIAGLAAIVITTTATGLVKHSWQERLAKLEQGILEDDNIAARVLWGPERLAECIAGNPSVLLTGAGLDPEKLASKANRDLNFESGLVSNGFLLALYYLGIGGFVLFGLFWVWAFSAAKRLLPPARSVVCGFVVMAIVIVAADNYSFIYEPAMGLLFLIVGLIAGQRHRQLVAQRYAEVVPLEPDAAPQSYAA